MLHTLVYLNFYNDALKVIFFVRQASASPEKGHKVPWLDEVITLQFFIDSKNWIYDSILHSILRINVFYDFKKDALEVELWL